MRIFFLLSMWFSNCFLYNGSNKSPMLLEYSIYEDSKLIAMELYYQDDLAYMYANDDFMKGFTNATLKYKDRPDYLVRTHLTNQIMSLGFDVFNWSALEPNQYRITPLSDTIEIFGLIGNKYQIEDFSSKKVFIVFTTKAEINIKHHLSYTYPLLEGLPIQIEKDGKKTVLTKFERATDIDVIRAYFPEDMQVSNQFSEMVKSFGMDEDAYMQLVKEKIKELSGN